MTFSTTPREVLARVGLVQQLPLSATQSGRCLLDYAAQIGLPTNELERRRDPSNRLEYHAQCRFFKTFVTTDRDCINCCC